MTYKFLPFLAAAVIIATGIHSEAAATATKKKTTSAAKKPAAKSTAAKRAPVKKGAPASSRQAASKRRNARKTPPRPRGQQAPAPGRNTEIQQALIDRGFMTGPPTGTWGPDSADALKRFQLSQNITATGKLDSLSLIALGLGPKRNATALARPTNENRSTEGSKGP